MSLRVKSRDVLVWKAPEDYCRILDNKPGGRVVWRTACGEVAITVHRGRADDCYGVWHLCARALLNGEVVGFATGFAADLNKYEDHCDFADDMDAIDQTTYDAAMAIAALGEEHWDTRDRLLFLDRAEVVPTYRRRGIGRALVESLVAASGKKGHVLELLLQPYPDAIKGVPPDQVAGRRRATAAERRLELEKTTQIWLWVFPFLTFLNKGGLHKNREYYFGTVPTRDSDR